MTVSLETLALAFGGWLLVALYLSFQSSRDSSANERKEAKRRTSIGTVLDTRNFRPFPLIKKVNVSHNTRIFRFGLPEGTSLGLPTGRHLQFRATIDGKMQYRSYTPISDNDDVGFFELMVKVYPNGKFSRHLDSLEVGDHVDVKGPKGEFDFEHGRWDSISMLAGGTGITPMLQIIKDVLKSAESGRTRLDLIFANVTEEDILLKDVLDKWAADHPERFRVSYTLDQPSDVWSGYKGFISTEMIEKAGLPGPGDNTMVLICGPSMMCKAMVKNLEQLGYPEEKFFYRF